MGNDCSVAAKFADVDNDDDADIVTATTSIKGDYPTGIGANKVWLNDGKGKFTDSGQNLTLGTPSFDVDIADIDADGDLDILFGNSGPGTVWINDGKGHFTDSKQRLGDQHSYAVALRDLDGDGDMDAFICTRDHSGSRVWLNDGQGHFEDSAQRLGNAFTLGLTLADVDNDGDIEALLANRNMANEEELGNVQIWINDGKAHFTLDPVVVGSGHFRKVVVGNLSRH